MHVRDVSWDLASVPLSSGGLGLRSSNQRKSGSCLAQMGRRIGHDSTKAPRSGDAFEWSGVNPGFHVLGAIESHHRLGDGVSTVQSGARSLWETPLTATFLPGWAGLDKKSLHEFCRNTSTCGSAIHTPRKRCLRSRGGAWLARAAPSLGWSLWSSSCSCFAASGCLCIQPTYGPSMRPWLRPEAPTARPHVRWVREDGAAMMVARERKDARYPEQVGNGERATLLIWACKVGGTWSGESRNFSRRLSTARALRETLAVCLMQRRRLRHLACF